MNTSQWFEFEIAATVIGIPVCVSLRSVQDRWVAAVRCGTTTTDALGPNARAALVAALAPLGTLATARVMAEPIMFAASANLLEAAAV